MADKGALSPSGWFDDSGWKPCIGTPYVPQIPISAIPTDVSRQISGTVTEAGSPINGASVFLLWRPSMAVIKKTTTDKNGHYQFDNLLNGNNNYVVVMQDKEGGTIYNDIIRSLLTAG